MEQGLRTNEGGYVFTRPNGLPLVPKEVTRGFSVFVTEHNLPHLTFHGQRYAFANLSLLAAINPKVVSGALGHSNISITLDLYSHVLPNMQRYASEAVANLLTQ